VVGGGGLAVPARRPWLLASRRPFFFMIKLEPINTDELMARLRPVN